MKYKGSLSSTKMTGLVKKAYYKWLRQKDRCNNPKNISYKFYGKRGIKVEYSSREFIYWYLEKIKQFSGTNPAVGRIDHTKNYSIDNIEITSTSENSKERQLRCGPTTKKIPVVAYEIRTGKKIAEYESIRDAAKDLGIRMSQVAKHIKTPTCPNIRSKFTFRKKGEEFVPTTNKISKPIIIIDLINKKEILCDSATKASRITGVSTGHISKYCKGTLKRSRSGFTFRYAQPI